MVGRLFLLVATVLLFHAAYSAFERTSTLLALSFLSLTSQTDSSCLKAHAKPEKNLPLNAVYESLLALILGILGASLNAPPLKDITWSSELKKRTIDEMDSRLGFANYLVRGKSLVLPSRRS